MNIIRLLRTILNIKIICNFELYIVQITNYKFQISIVWP